MKVKQTVSSMVLVVTSAYAGLGITAAATDPAPAAPATSYAITKSMDPAVWSNVVNQMMQGQPAIGTCAACHEAETVARYQKDYGAYLNMADSSYQAMGNPAAWTGMMNPGTAMNPMSMMNPASSMMNPMSWMMNPMMGMMNPMMMAPMMGMMNPMMMAPMMGGMTNPMGMMSPGMGSTNPMGAMNPGMAAPGGQPMNQMMDPKQYEQFFKAWTQMMPGTGQTTQPAAK